MLKDKLAAIKSKMNKNSKESSDADSFATAKMDKPKEAKPKKVVKKPPMLALENIDSGKKVDALTLTLGGFGAA